MASGKLNFIGRVAVITGAGGGLGKQYALEFARRGASVVVNDLGGSFKGEGKGTQLADQVVKEIVEAGGKAIANYDSVEDGEKIIESAINHFGQVDILINNAGILRDRSFLKLSEEDWDKVFQVHVKGAFKVTKAAWPHMRKQKYGRIIMTTSPAGLYGNFGQSNYSAAKLALLGLANTLSIEGKKTNVFVNTIAPLALTRMTEDILPVPLYPEHVAPFVVYLCHDSCMENGSIIELAGGYACKTRLQRSQGAQLRQFIGDNPSVETVANHWDKLSDFKLPHYASTPNEAMEPIMKSIELLPEKPLPDTATPYERILAYRFPEVSFLYTIDDVIKYAISVGAKLPEDSSLLYEGHAKFAVLPTFAAIVGQNQAFGRFGEGIPGFEDIDISKVVHGEQYIEIFKPFPAQHSHVTCKGKIVDVLDKRKFCQVIIENEVFDELGDRICRNQFIALFLGSYGVGRRGRSDIQVSPLPPPNRPADACYEEKTDVSQAALYRLNGDKNPLHIDAEFASMMGFSQPILHGLCTYGYALRHVLKIYADNDVSKCKAIKAQFSKPVVPGQTLVTEMWCEGKRVHFRTKVKETNEVVLKGGYVDFTTEVKMKSKNSQSVAESTSTSSSKLQADQIFSELGRILPSNVDVTKKISGTFLFVITKDGQTAGEYLIDLKSSVPSVKTGSFSIKPDVKITVSDEDFVLLANEKLSSVTAFMQGKLKVAGKIMLAQKLGDMFKAYNKQKVTPTQVVDQNATASVDKSLKATSVLKDLETKIKSFPDLVQKVKGSFLFQITKANKLAGEWLINLNKSPPEITYGSPSLKPDVTIKLEDDDFESLALGKLLPMQAFMQGKLKATGKIMMAQKLGDLFKTHSSKL